MIATMTKPAQATLKAPKRLTAQLAAVGYTVELVVTRAEVATVDPDSDPGPVDAPVTADEKARLGALVAAYDADAQAAADKAPTFKPPQ
jgi:hypothetical protein